MLVYRKCVCVCIDIHIDRYTGVASPSLSLSLSLSLSPSLCISALAVLDMQKRIEVVHDPAPPQRRSCPIFPLKRGLFSISANPRGVALTDYFTPPGQYGQIHRDTYIPVPHLHFGVLEPDGSIAVVYFQSTLPDTARAIKLELGLLPHGVLDPDRNGMPVASDAVLKLGGDSGN